MPLNQQETSSLMQKHRTEAPPIRSILYRRKLFFRNYQVLRAKNRVYGKDLPLNQVW
jgi:hypothetical protein